MKALMNFPATGGRYCIHVDALIRRGTRAHPRRGRCESARSRWQQSRPRSSLAMYSESCEGAGYAAHPEFACLRRISAGLSPRTTTSETAKRPPGFSTRKASRST